MWISKFYSPVFEARYIVVERGESILCKSFTSSLPSEPCEDDFNAKKEREREIVDINVDNSELTWTKTVKFFAGPDFIHIIETGDTMLRAGNSDEILRDFTVVHYFSIWTTNNRYACARRICLPTTYIALQGAFVVCLNI